MTNNITKESTWGWNTLPLELRQQIVTEALNDAMKIKSMRENPRSVAELCKALAATSNSLGENDLLRPLLQLSEHIDQTMDELKAARETMRRDAISLIIATEGYLHPVHSADVFQTFRVEPGHWCNTCEMVSHYRQLDLNIVLAQVDMEICQMWVRCGLTFVGEPGYLQYTLENRRKRKCEWQREADTSLGGDEGEQVVED